MFKLLESGKTREVLRLKSEKVKNSIIPHEMDLHRSTVTYHVSRLKGNSLLEEGRGLEILREEDMI